MHQRNFQILIAVVVIGLIFALGKGVTTIHANQAGISAVTTTPGSGNPGAATPTPISLSGGSMAATSAEQVQLKAVIQSYFDLRYQALNTLNLTGFGDLVSNASDAEPSLQAELGKLQAQIKQAQLNHLRYVNYKYSLDYKNISIDNAAQEAVVIVMEGNDVVYEISQQLNPANPVVSHLYNLQHTIALRKEGGSWKITDDKYEDYLWHILKTTGISPDKLQSSLKAAPMPTAHSITPLTKSSNSLAANGLSHDYNGQAAASYADEYANSNNPLYYYFQDDDCTNYVSQAIYEGGNASMAYPPNACWNPGDTTDNCTGTFGWFWTDLSHRAAAWDDVSQLYNFITQGAGWTEGPAGSEVQSIDQLVVGDLIQYSDDGSFWKHTAIVTAIVNGVPYIDSHSPYESQQPYTIYNIAYMRYIHIDHINLSSPRGFNSDGITGSYYNDTPPDQINIEVPIYWNTFTNYVLSRLDPYIAFNTGTNSPAPGVNGTFWSAIWEGNLSVPTDGDYIFYFKNLDDGARLFVDGTEVLESWRVQGFHQYQTNPPVTLTAGLHTIRVEYAQGPGFDGGLTVEWSSASFKEKIGPYSLITSSPTPTQTPTATVTPSPTPTQTPTATVIPSPTPTLIPTATVIPSPTPPPAPTTPPCTCIFDWLFGRCQQASVRKFAISLNNSADDLELFYQFRDNFLAKTPAGQKYIDLFYKRSPEVIELVQSDPALDAEIRSLIQLWTPNLQLLVNGQGSQSLITQAQIEALKDFANHLAVNASPELQQAIADNLAARSPDELVNKTMDGAWAYVNGYKLDWLPPLNAADPYLASKDRTIPVEFTLSDLQGNFVIDDSVRIRVLDSIGNIVIGPIGLGNNPANGIAIQGKNKYHYNLLTKGLLPGSYTLQIFYNAVTPNEPAIWLIQIRAN